MKKKFIVFLLLSCFVVNSQLLSMEGPRIESVTVKFFQPNSGRNSSNSTDDLPLGHASVTELNEDTKSVDNDDNGNEPNRPVKQSPRRNNSSLLPYKIAAGTLGALSLGATFITLKDKINQQADDQRNLREKLSDFAVSRLVAPVLIKYEEYKEDGFGIKNFLRVTCPILGAFGLKKANNSFGLRDKALSGLSYVKNYLQDNPRARWLSISALGGSVLLLNFYKWAQADKEFEQNNSDLIRIFWNSLTEEQQRTIQNSENFLALMNQAQKDLSVLLKNKQFLDILSENQKEFLIRTCTENSQDC